MGEASIDALLEFEAYNYTGSTWHHLDNNLTYSGLAVSGYPTGLNDFVSNNIPENGFISPGGNITIRVTATAGTTFQTYDNWININLKTASGVVQDLKGSGEIHVNDWFDYYRQSYTDSAWTNFTGNITTNILNQTGNSSARFVWNYSESISDNILNQTANASANFVWNYSETINSLIINQFVNAVWAYTGTINGNITYQFTETIWNWTGTISSVITDTISGEVWTWSTRNLTWYNMTDTTNYTKINSEIPELVWNYTTREITGGNVSVDTSNISSDIWSYENRTITGGNISGGNVSIDTDAVWNYSGVVNPNITGQIVNDTWNATARYTHGVIV